VHGVFRNPYRSQNGYFFSQNGVVLPTCNGIFHYVLPKGVSRTAISAKLRTAEVNSCGGGGLGASEAPWKMASAWRLLSHIIA
jgi:hypothetical protein